MDVLIAAWHAIRRNAETSASPLTREIARKFGEDLPRNLKSIQSRLGSKQGYQFALAVGATPKKGKGKSGKRPLVIAPLQDRIVQRALLDVLQDADELTGVQAVLNTPTSVGGIRGRGVEQAIQQIEEAYRAGNYYVAGSDISGFFTKIPRNEVINFVRAQTDDEEFLDLLSKAMSVELANAERLPPEDLRMFPTGNDGVAQGCPLSAFAGNVALHEFDSVMNGRGLICIRYIDDFILIGKVERHVRKAFESAGDYLSRMGMSIYDPVEHPRKAFIGTLSDGHEFLGYKLLPGVYPPSDRARASLLERIRNEFRRGGVAMKVATRGEASHKREQCYIQTLWKVDQILRGWAGSFSASRCAATMGKLDEDIDLMLKSFNRLYGKLTQGRTRSDCRRALGVCLLQDRSHLRPL